MSTVKSEIEDKKSNFSDESWSHIIEIETSVMILADTLTIIPRAFDIFSLVCRNGRYM